MAKVFANDMVAHVWAQMTQDEGRSHNGNFSFDGNTLYSYSTPIAQIHHTRHGAVVLMTERSFSTTTNGKHKNAVWRATNYGRTLPVHVVPFIGAWGGQAISSDRMSSDAERHAANVAYLVDQYEQRKAKIARMRDIWSTVQEMLQSAHDEAMAYARDFDLTPPALDLAKDVADIEAKRAAREARNADPAYQAKRERERAARERRQAEKERIAALAKFEREAEMRARWLEGGSIWGATLRTENGGALLRVKGDNLETSQGASVPLAHAVKVFRFVKACRDNARDWHRNGHTIRVGHFQVDRIAANGDFHAGCHFIEWSECERIARAIGVFDMPPSNEALEPSAHVA